MIPRKISLAFIFILIYAIPSLVFVYFHQDSLASGMIIACFVVLIYSFNTIYFLTFRAIYFAIVLLLLFLLFIQSYYLLVTESISKPFFSVPALFIVFISSLLLSFKLRRMPFEVVINSLRNATYFFFICGWVAIVFKLKIGPYSLFDKPVIPFSEESHYALCIGFLGCTSGYFSNAKHKKFIFINLIGQSVLFPSLTLFIFSVLSIVIFWLTKNIAKLVFFSALMLACFIISVNLFSDSIAFQYFSSRLNFSADSSNMTTLVFLQGIDDAYRSLMNTSGLGLGFQMAGTDQPGIYGYTIAHISGSFLNRTDGGFIASKLISEFGIIGLLAVIWFCFKLIYGIRILGKNASTEDGSQDARFLPYVLLIVFSVEFLLRGYGYFSPGVLIFITLYHLSKNIRGNR